MNIKRYLIYGGISIAVHSVLLNAAPVQKPIRISLAEETPSIQIQFVSLAKPEPVKPQQEPETLKTKPQQKSKPEKVTQPVKKTIPPVNKPVLTAKPKPIAATKPEVKQEKPKVKQTTPAAKPVIKQQKPAVSAVAKTSIPKLIEKPKFKAKPTPITYPRLAKRRGHQGKVLVEVWIDSKGIQTKRMVINSSGFDALDEAALKAISKWKFDVAYQQQKHQQGIAIAHRVHIPVNFKLN